ncbi:MAG TPA: outer membrane protein assembly factor BamA [Thermoanaerobaculia bacterium]|nr:outer membrane protein assembly factor BamA [Thermoanaerobaculia bacterium]
MEEKTEPTMRSDGDAVPESSFRRQRTRPIRGCIRLLGWGLIVLVMVLLLISGGAWYYFGTDNFAAVIKARVEQNLEWRLGRDVRIGRVVVSRSLGRVLLQDISIANVPGGRREHFAFVREVEIVGGIESFWTRTIRVGRVDVRDARLNVEIFPRESPVLHNFPSWRRGERRRFQITRVEIEKMFVTGADVELLDHRHDFHVVARSISSEVTPTLRKSIYVGDAESPSVTLRFKDYEPIALEMRAHYDYHPGALTLSPAVFEGGGIEIIAEGAIEPLTEAVYDFEIAARTELARVREVFRVEPELEGLVSFDGGIRGEKGDFRLEGGFRIPALLADTYELANFTGRVTADPDTVGVEIESADYGGGTLTGDYRLEQIAEPYPMSVDLRYQAVSLEKLFEDWNVPATGLRGAATGTLRYAWEKNDLLRGSGEGDARLAPGAVAFGDARYPIPVSGQTRFALDSGVIRFGSSSLRTPRSVVDFRGNLGIEGLVADLAVDIRSRDFAELDRIAFNFARALDKPDFELLGLAGSGRIAGTVRGPLDAATVVARLTGSDFRYNAILLGSAEMTLRWDGRAGVLRFDPAVFRDAGGSVVLTGTISFPDTGPSPRFDLRAEVAGYPAERILAAVELDLEIRGTGTGVVLVEGVPDRGRATFEGVTIVRDDRRINLGGMVDWEPGEGNVSFDLDLGVTSVPVSEVLAFLEIDDLPITGEMTGTLHLEGPKEELEGAGAVTIRNGTIFGEPIELARADLDFHEGVMTAEGIEIHSAAGVLRGEASVDLGEERFSYTLEPGELDLSRIGLLSALEGLFGGRIRISSTGAGTFEQPDLLVEAVLVEGAVQGRELPVEGEPPRLYFAMRGGQLRIIGSAWDALAIEGTGLVQPDGTIDGSVEIRVADLQTLLEHTSRTDLRATGTALVRLELGGNTESIETIRIDGTVPEMALVVSGHQIVPLEPIRFRLAEGVVHVDSMRLQTDGSQLAVSGRAALTGAREIDVRIDGLAEAALLQLFVPDTRMDGHVNVSASILGTVDRPRIRGTAEVRDGELRASGFPQLIDDITATLVFGEDRLKIDSLTATVGGGRIVAGGFIGLDGITPTRFQLSMQGTEVALRYFEGITLQGNFDLVLSGDPERSLLQGEVIVDRGLYYRDFDVTTSVLNLLLERRVIAPEIAASWQNQVALRVEVRAPETLAVRNNIADVTASAELEIRGTLANPTILGVVTVDEGGTIRFQDVEYRVVRGTINFQNPFRVDPFFDITAEGRRGEYDLTINLTGTLDRITPTIASDPPTSDLTLLSLLAPPASDPTQTDPAGLELENLGAAGGSLLLQSVGELIGSRIFPFADAFRLDAGLLAEVSEPKVTFEKRVSDDLRAIVVYFLNSRENIEIVEWQVTPDWMIQFVQDTRQDSDFFIDSVEGRFRRRYSGHWLSRKDRNEAIVAADVPVGRQPPPAPTPESDEIAPLSQTLERPIVASVEFAAEAVLNRERLAEVASAVVVGEPLSLRAMQTAIKGLYGTGEFGDVRVDASPAGDGSVHVRFLLFLNYRIGTIRVEGLPISRDAISGALAVREGETLSLDAVDRSATAIAEELHRHGWIEATVDPEIQYSRPTNRADATFHVTPGRQALVGSVELQGSLGPFAPREIIARMRLQTGSVFSAAAARRDAERILDFLIDRGYRRASVRYLEREYEPDHGTVRLRYRIEAGLPVRVEVEGVERGAVGRLLPFRGDEPYSEDLVDRAVDEIRNLYQRRGHYFVTVDAEEREVDAAWVVTFHIEPGSRYQLESVEFDGNAQLDDDRLRAAIATAPSGGFRTFLRNLLRRPGGVNDETLVEDIASLQSLYRLEGFTRASVGRPLVEPSGPDRLTVTFPVNEGPRSMVREVRIEGNERFPAEALPELALDPGDPLNPRLVYGDVVELRSFYGERGHVEVQVSPQFEFDDERTSVSVAYRIAEGPSADIAAVVVRGNTYTETEVIRRQAKIEPGEPFSYRTMLQAQRELYRLGIFQRVDVIPEDAGASVAGRNVVLSVEEGRALTIGGSFGYSDEQGLGGSFSLSHRNLLGTARFLGLEARYFEREQRYLLSYREPFILDLDIPVQLTVFRSDEERRGVQLERLGSFIEASRVLGESVRWSTRYEYRRVDCFNLTGEEICGSFEIPREEREVTISSISPAVFWDRRDDPLNPFEGIYASASLEYAFPLFAAESTFLKGFAQSAWYRPLSQRSTLALSARVGLIHRLASSGAAALVPFPERFTSGGESSHRAFELDRLGILCDDTDPDCEPTLIEIDGQLFPLGGNALVVANAEYRFPIFGSLQGATFVDLGNVWRDIEDIDLGQARYGAGVGIRYLTPLGPIRFDIGWNLDPEPFEEPYATFLTIGFAY